MKGSSVGLIADASMDGMSSASIRIGRCAYEPISSSPPCCRWYMFVSTSRMIGNSISPTLSANIGTGPTSIIWCTAGVSGIDAPAIAAIRGLHTPHATTTTSVRMSPRSVRTPAIRPRSTSMPVTSLLAEIVSAPVAWPCSRISVPARSESTTPTPGVWKPPRMT